MLFLYSNVSANIQITDPLLRAYLQGANSSNGRILNTANQSISINIDSSGNISQADAELVSALVIEYTTITNIDEVTKFPNLGRINCFNNNHLSVVNLANHAVLWQINFNFNFKIRLSLIRWKSFLDTLFLN